VASGKLATVLSGAPITLAADTTSHSFCSIRRGFSGRPSSSLSSGALPSAPSEQGGPIVLQVRGACSYLV
jgi:hypothetical protein